MPDEDSKDEAAESVESDCGLAFYDEMAEKQGLSVKAERSPREDLIMREALGLMKSSDAKWFDARGQSGPSPSDFGDHKPIPKEAIYAESVISSVEKEMDVEDPNVMSDDLQEEIRHVLNHKEE